jgi:hypothetical protein
VTEEVREYVAKRAADGSPSIPEGESYLWARLAA